MILRKMLRILTVVELDNGVLVTTGDITLDYGVVVTGGVLVTLVEEHVDTNHPQYEDRHRGDYDCWQDSVVLKNTVFCLIIIFSLWLVDEHNWFLLFNRVFIHQR